MLPLTLKWQRDSQGYRVGDQARVEKPPSIPSWLVSGRPPLQTSAAGGGAKAAPSPLWLDTIYPAGGKPIPYEPLKTPGLYLKFAEVDSPEALLRFVNRFGLLTRTWEDRHSGEHVEVALGQAEELRGLVKVLAGARGDGTQVKLSRAIGLTLVLGAKKKLQFEPANLLWGLWLQAVSRYADLRQCLLCGEFFEVGPDSKPHRRGDARYCSEEHRIRHKSLRRSL